MNVSLTKRIITQIPGDKSVMLRAKHGVGKSSVIKQCAIENGMTYHDVRLSQCEVGDIKGLPLLDAEAGTTRFLKPYWWPRDMNSKGILFFDELNRASKDVLQAVFEICLDRRLDGEALPDGWRVVAAINADDDYDVAELDPALLDRWFIIDFDPSPKEWIDWARAAKVHPAVVEFIARNHNLIDPPVGNLEAGRVYPSRRSWVALSDSILAMNLVDDTDGLITQVAKGWVGREVAVQFQKFMTNEFSLLKPSDVLDKYDEYLPKIEAACSDIEVIAALANSVIAEIGERSAARMKDKQADNLKKFFAIIPKDVAASFWTQLLANTKSKKIAMTWQSDPEFTATLRGVYGMKKAEVKEETKP
jgi:hypothetical protein